MVGKDGGNVGCEITVKIPVASYTAGSPMVASIVARADPAEDWTGGQEDAAQGASHAPIPGVGRAKGGSIPVGGRSGYSLHFDVRHRSSSDEQYSRAKQRSVSSNNGGGSGENTMEERQRQRRAFEGMEKDGVVLLNHLVVQVSGRWICDNSWVAQHAHTSAPPDPACEQYAKEPWAGALEDASHYGGGGFEGYSGFIFRSKPHVVARNEPIFCGSQTLFEISCELPEPIPPSLRGTAVRYSYALAVVAAFDNCAPKSLRIPFRVVPSPDLLAEAEVIPVPFIYHPLSDGSEFMPVERLEPLKVVSHIVTSLPPDDVDLALALSLNGRLTPYRADNEIAASEAQQADSDSVVVDAPRYGVPENHCGDPDVNQAFQRLGFLDGNHTGGDGSASPANAHRDALPVYLLKKGEGRIGRLFLPKKVHGLGETLTAIFDLSDQEVPCYRLSASLEVQEIVNPQYALGTKDRRKGDESGTAFRKVYGEHSEYVSQAMNTYLVLSIPRDAPVSFRTSAVEVKWQLVFAFLTPSDASLAAAQEAARDDDTWFMPEKDVEVLHWSLPLSVVGSAKQ